MDLTDIPGEVKKTRAEKRVGNKQAYTAVKAEEGEIISPPLPTPLTDSITPFGRPTKYTQEIADELCAMLASGRSLRTACSQAHMPVIATVYNWFRVHPDFLEQYTRAKADAADAMAEDIIDLADQPDEYTETVTLADGTITTRRIDNVRRTQLRIETRKWLMAKLQPRKYSEKLDLTSGGDKLPVPLLSGLANASDDIPQLNEGNE
jgi:hypothetical protein